MGRRLEGGPTASYGEKCTSEKERGEKDEQGGKEGEDEDEVAASMLQVWRTCSRSAEPENTSSMSEGRFIS